MRLWKDKTDALHRVRHPDRQRPFVSEIDGKIVKKEIDGNQSKANQSVEASLLANRIPYGSVAGKAAIFCLYLTKSSLVDSFTVKEKENQSEMERNANTQTSETLQGLDFVFLRTSLSSRPRRGSQKRPIIICPLSPRRTGPDKMACMSEMCVWVCVSGSVSKR